MNTHTEVPDSPRFTIFIPCFNRAHTLVRALRSIEAQTCRDFEVLIVDDGSTDNTHEVIESWRDRLEFPIYYVYQENQGKHVAHNTALRHACGELTVILDSDDMLVPNALARLNHYWQSIPVDQVRHYAGVEGLCACMSDGSVAGSLFPQDVIDATYIDIRKRYGVGGDKKNAIRTEVLREFPYPQFPGERHIRPSLVWNRMARKYLFRYFNEIIQLIEYQPGGLSADRFRLRMRNPRGFRLCYLEEIDLLGEVVRPAERRAAAANYVRYSLHASIGLAEQWQGMDAKMLWLASLPRGVLSFVGDQFRLRYIGRRRT